MARIVIADDDDDIRELVELKLRAMGHETAAFTDGRSAVEACREQLPDLVMLDVMMPGMDGLEATRALRADQATARVPIILLTARAHESDIDRGFTAGADDYLTKPFGLRELADRVTTVLAARQ